MAKSAFVVENGSDILFVHSVYLDNMVNTESFRKVQHLLVPFWYGTIVDDVGSSELLCNLQFIV